MKERKKEKEDKRKEAKKGLIWRKIKEKALER